MTLEADPQFQDPEVEAGFQALAAAEARAQARGFITGWTVSQYVNRHPQGERKRDPHTNELEPPPAPEFLAVDEGRTAWMIRWPSGNTRWESAERLIAIGFKIPDRPLLGICEGSYS